MHEQTVHEVVEIDHQDFDEYWAKNAAHTRSAKVHLPMLMHLLLQTLGTLYVKASTMSLFVLSVALPFLV